MKGFIIYETPLWGNEENTVYLQEVKDASYTLKQIGSDDITCYLEGIATKDPVTKAACNKDDTYDFEVGALIALMKKCGAKKAAEACCEAFPHETSGSIYRENKRYIKRIKELEKENERLKEKVDDFYAYNKGLINELDQKNHEIISLKTLKLTNESLKKDNESFRKTCEKLKEENKHIKEKNAELLGQKSCLNYIKSCNESTIKSLENTRDLLIDKNNELIEENEKLKLDCEKLQHGYNDMIFCGGRQNGKQYTALVNMFKKLDQKKVDAAYKEAYNTTLPVWQKEVLNQMYGVYKESKEKIEVQGFHIEIKPSTKREEMWENILGGSKSSPVEVKVSKQDITSFLRELQDKIPEARWNGSDCKPTEYTNHYWFNHDYIYFALFRYDDKANLKICFDENKHNWINKPVIEYLPPMRWDLFKKGRKIVRITPENLDDFMTKCSNNLGCIIKPAYKYDTHVFIMISDYHYDNKPTLHIMSPEDLVRNQYENPKKYSDKKIVDWEDVK